MKSKNKLFVLIAAIGIFCCGCASEITEESLISEVNEASVGSDSFEETKDDSQESYDEYSGNWPTGGISYHSEILT